MQAPSPPCEPSIPAVVHPVPMNHSHKKRKHSAITNVAAPSPVPSDPGATPALTTENQVLPTRHHDLSSRQRLDISRHPVFVPLAPGSEYHTTEPLCNNRLGFRYTPAGLTQTGSAIAFRTIESAPTSYRISWEDRSPFVRVTTDGLRLKGEKGFRSARCNAPVREGKWYMEIKVERGGGENASNSQRREGSHVRLGWARREAPLNGPVGLDGYSYALRDKTGEKVHLSRSRPYGKSVKSGDVVGMYISLPPRRKPDRKDPYDPAHIKRARIPIDFKGQEYFESLEYPQSKEMMELMNAREREKAENTNSMPSSSTKKSATVKNVPSARGAKSTQQEPSPLRPLPTLGPDSHIAFFINGKPQGIAFQDLLDYLPLRNPSKSREKTKKNKDGLREHKENPFDDGTLGYYPVISLFNEAKVRINPGPNFDFPPPPDIDAVLSSSDWDGRDIKPLSSENTLTWRPMCERYAEYMAEQHALDALEEQEALKVLGTSQQLETTEQEKLLAEKAEKHREKRRAQAVARRERKAKQAKEEAAAAKRKKMEEGLAMDGEVEIDLHVADGHFAHNASSPPTLALADVSDRRYQSVEPPARMVASSMDYHHIPSIVVRHDTSEYNSEYEDPDADFDGLLLGSEDTGYQGRNSSPPEDN